MTNSYTNGKGLRLPGETRIKTLKSNSIEFRTSKP